MKKVSTPLLIPGMIVARNVFTFSQELLLTKGTVLTDKLITRLENYNILSIYVEEDMSAVAPSADMDPGYTRYNRIKKSPEFQKFKDQYTQIVDDFRDSINAVVKYSKKLDLDALLESAQNLVTYSNQVNIADTLQSMREYDESTFAHSLNVALLCNLISTWVHFDKDGIFRATLCGLLHDVGKLKVPSSILNKPLQLSDMEFKIVKQHPISGYQFLASQNMDPSICNAALMHHERFDGTGYPLHLEGEQIDCYARIVAIADVYDAMTAARCYRAPLCPFHVIELFEAEGFQKYDVAYLLPFLENVMNTYIQNRCHLSDGREGDIIYINKYNLARPIVQCGNEYINLADEPDLKISYLL